MIESSGQLENDGRLSGLQAARALAACAVTLGHAILNPITASVGWVEFLGTYGVALFFVISGYIMVRTTGTGTFKPFRFLLRRVLRIAPLYWIACALLAGAVIVLPYSFRSTTLQDPAYVLKSLLFLPDFAPRFPGEVWPFYKLGWTLNLEMFFYVTFAAFAFLRARSRAAMTTAVIVAMVALGPLLDVQSAALRLYAYPINLGFAAGMWLGVLELPPTHRLTRRFAALLLIASTVSLAGALAAFDLFYTNQLPYMVWLLATVLAQIVLVVLYVDRRPSSVPRWCVQLGDASYSIYLFHMFVVTAVYRIVIMMLPGQYVLAVLVSFLASILGGVVAHHLIERPIMRLLNHVGRGPARDSTGAVAFGKTKGTA